MADRCDLSTCPNATLLWLLHPAGIESDYVNPLDIWIQKKRARLQRPQVAPIRLREIGSHIDCRRDRCERQVFWAWGGD